jgi:hypothetical protein
VVDEGGGSLGGGSVQVSSGASLAQIQAELDQRKLTLTRMDALARVADGESGQNANAVGTYAHQNNTNEQDAIVFAAGKIPATVSFDMNNLAQSTTVRIYEQVDGANYRLLNSAVFPTDYPAGVKVVEVSFTRKNRACKVTFQSGTGEGSSKNVPYATSEWLR